MYGQIISGIVTGVGYSLLGWGKENTKGNVAKLNFRRMLISATACAVVGGIAGYMNQDFNVLLTGAVGVSVTKVVNLAYKNIFNRV